MRSPTAALAWEIWSRSRTAVWAVVVMTAFGFAQGGITASPFTELVGMLSFVLLFGVFNDTELPIRRLTLPVSSLQLVAVPMALGVVSIELLYLLWTVPRGDSTPSLLMAVLFGVFMLCFQAATWTLASFGLVRIAAIGALGIVFLAIGILSSNERSTAVFIAGAGAAAIFAAWTFVGRVRSHGGRAASFPLRAIEVPAIGGSIAPFESPAGAQAWLEWRRGGATLPLLVGGLLLAIAPFAWGVRANARVSIRLLTLTLAMPLIVAIPVGVAFSKPRFWSDDLSVPDSLAVQPLDSSEWVAIKMRVAAKAAAMSWLLVLAFVALWLPLWFDAAALRQIWPGWIKASMLGGAGVFVTWRLLVVRLWAGLSGSRRLYFASGVSAVFVPIAALIFDDDIRELFADPGRLDLLFWTLSILAAIKYAIAARLWLSSGGVHRSRVLGIWLAGSIYLTGLSGWQYGWRGLPIVFALLLAPITRLLAAPLTLARNRHRP